MADDHTQIDQPTKVVKRLETIYTSACANRHENTISCFKNFILYPSTNCPVIYDLNNEQVTQFLLGHTDEVNSLQIIQDCTTNCPYFDEESKTFFIISTSYDKSAIIWRVSLSPDDVSIKTDQIIRFHSPNEGGEFTTSCSLRQNDSFLSVTTSIGGSIHLWRNDQLAETLETQFCYFNSKLHTLTAQNGQSFTFLLLASSSNRVHVFQLANYSKLMPLFELAGHNDWIKCLQLLDIPDRPTEFLLGSASQDAFIRVWHMKLVDHEISSSQVRTTVSEQIYSSVGVEQRPFRLTATLETVLSGHEGIIYSICWFKKQPKPALQLVSCSADKTIIIWKSSLGNDGEHGQQLNQYDQRSASAEVWKESQRVGETGETNLPFLGVCLSEDESTFFVQSLRGAIQSWTVCEDGTWIGGPTIKGHFEPVTGLSWERSGAYLLSCSQDKTCRMHAVAAKDSRYHEIARPQVHGHEINCVASIDFGRYATGAEEKVIRTFGATKFFVKNFTALAKAEVPKSLLSELEDLPAHAQLPALGLSNKGAQFPYDIEDPNEKNSGNASNIWYGMSGLAEQLSKVEHLDRIPNEDILIQSTLWWETNKLYAHGNELYSLAVDSTGSFMASSSKATRVDVGRIFVWETLKFRRVATIEHHTMTITRLKFSPDNKYLLSVSRDRTWCIAKQTGRQRTAYTKLLAVTKTTTSHKRIIWDCCWSYDSKYFMTVSRDKTAMLWSIDDLILNEQHQAGECFAPVVSKEFEFSIQAVDSSPCPLASNSYLFVFGLENGSLILSQVSMDNNNSDSVINNTFQTTMVIENFHHMSIRRLAFKPNSQFEHDNKNEILLASCGDDRMVKLSKIFL